MFYGNREIKIVLFKINAILNEVQFSFKITPIEVVLKGHHYVNTKKTFTIHDGHVGTVLIKMCDISKGVIESEIVVKKGNITEGKNELIRKVTNVLHFHTTIVNNINHSLVNNQSTIYRSKIGM